MTANQYCRVLVGRVNSIVGGQSGSAHRGSEARRGVSEADRSGGSQGASRSGNTEEVSKVRRGRVLDGLVS